MATKEERKQEKKVRKEKRKLARRNWKEPVKDWFEGLARFIATHPWKVCIITFLFNGLLGLGMLNLPASKLLNNTIEDLYVPDGNPTEERAQSLLNLFPDTSGHDFYAHQSLKQPLFGEVMLWRHDKGNILNGSCFNEIEAIVKYVKNISTFTTNGGYAKYEDVCARRNGNCVVHGEEIVELIENNVNGAIKMQDLYNRGGEHYEGSLVNLADYDVENGTLSRAQFLKIRFYLRQDGDTAMKDAKLWQDHFVTYMKRFIRKWYPETLHIVFRHSGSFYEELGNDTFMDIPYFSFVFTVFLTYLGIVMSGGNIISKRIHIARIGIIVTPVSVLGAWGILMGSGLEFTNTVGVIPLFIQCHQIINAMTTMSHVSDVNDVKDAHKRVTHAIRNAAIPITMTTLIHVLTFIPGIFSNYYVMRLVSIYTVVTVLFNYFNHFVFFTACLALHEHRIDAGLHCCTWTKLTPREQLQSEGRSCCVICCCSGVRPETREDTESGPERLSRNCMTRFVLTAPMKFISVLVFVVYFALLVWGLTLYDMDSVQVNKVLSKSYFHNWDKHYSRAFQNESIVQFVTIHPQGYIQNKTLIGDFERSIRSKAYIHPDSFFSWYSDYKLNAGQNITSEEKFVSYLQESFLPSSPVFKHDVVFDKYRDRLLASRFYVRTHDVPSTKSMIDIKADLKEVVDDVNEYIEDVLENSGSDKEAYPFTFKVENDERFIAHSPDFLATDWYKLPLWEILKMTGVQFVLFYTLFLIVHPSLTTAVHIPICFFSMTAGLYGLSHFLGIYLTPVPMICYVVATCYFVEVIGHTYHAFFESSGTSCASRVNVVIGTATQALFHTIFGQFLGILVMIVDESYVFVTVFIIFILTTGTCVVHSVFFIPTLIALAGPQVENIPGDSIATFNLEMATVSSGNGVRAGASSGTANGNRNNAYIPDA